MNLYKSKNGYYYKEMKKKKIRISKVVYDKLKGNKTVGNKTVGNKTVGKKTVGNKTVGKKTVGKKTVGKKTVGKKTPIKRGGANEYEKEIIVILIGFTVDAIERLRLNKNKTNDEKYRDVTVDVDEKYQTFLGNQIEYIKKKKLSEKLLKDITNSRNSQLHNRIPNNGQVNLHRNFIVNKIKDFTKTIKECNNEIMKSVPANNSDTLIDKYKEEIICILLDYTPQRSNNTSGNSARYNATLVKDEIDKYIQAQSQYTYQRQPDIKLIDILKLTIFDDPISPIPTTLREGTVMDEIPSMKNFPIKTLMENRLDKNHKHTRQSWKELARQSPQNICIVGNHPTSENHHCRGCGYIVCSEHLNNMNDVGRIISIFIDKFPNIQDTRTKPLKKFDKNDPIIQFTASSVIHRTSVNVCDICAKKSRIIDMAVLINNRDIHNFIATIHRLLSYDIKENLDKICIPSTFIQNFILLYSEYIEIIQNILFIFHDFFDFKKEIFLENSKVNSITTHIEDIGTLNFKRFTENYIQHLLFVNNDNIMDIFKISEKVNEKYVTTAIGKLKHLSQTNMALAYSFDKTVLKYIDILKWTDEINIFNNIENTNLPIEIMKIIIVVVKSIENKLKLYHNIQVIDPFEISEALTYILVKSDTTYILTKFKIIKKIYNDDHLGEQHVMRINVLEISLDKLTRYVRLCIVKDKLINHGKFTTDDEFVIFVENFTQNSILGFNKLFKLSDEELLQVATKTLKNDSKNNRGKNNIKNQSNVKTNISNPPIDNSDDSDDSDDSPKKKNSPKHKKSVMFTNNTKTLNGNVRKIQPIPKENKTNTLSLSVVRLRDLGQLNKIKSEINLVNNITVLQSGIRNIEKIYTNYYNNHNEKNKVILRMIPQLKIHIEKRIKSILLNQDRKLNEQMDSRTGTLYDYSKTLTNITGLDDLDNDLNNLLD